jgi:putative addiction module component (TIGR02574 family)
MATIEQVTKNALELSENERANLAHTLLLSLDPIEEGVAEAWDVEISRRLDEVLRGEAKGRPAEDVFRDIRARYQK